MQITYKQYKRVKLPNLGFIQFLGEKYLPGTNAFLILDNVGNRTGYIGTFSPGKLASSHVIGVMKEKDASSQIAGKVYLGIPRGISVNTRLVATLIKLAFPKGGLPVDFEGIYNAVASQRRIPIMRLADAEKVAFEHSGVPFDNYKLANDLINAPEITIDIDEMPPEDLIP